MKLDFLFPLSRRTAEFLLLLSVLGYSFFWDLNASLMTATNAMREDFLQNELIHVNPEMWSVIKLFLHGGAHRAGWIKQVIFYVTSQNEVCYTDRTTCRVRLLMID